MSNDLVRVTSKEKGRLDWFAKGLAELVSIVQPQTLLRWVREDRGAARFPRGNAINQFFEHCHRERNHQSLENRLIDPGEGVGSAEGEIDCHKSLGGMLKYYHCKAA